MRPAAHWPRAAGRCLLLATSLLASAEAFSQTPPDGWRIRFDASRADLLDKGRLTLGSATAASSGVDDLDEPHPPALPSRYLDIVTRHTQDEPGWAAQALPTVRYRAEYLAPVAAAGRTIDFFLETDSAGPVTLTWSISPDRDLAAHFLTLRDVSTAVAVDLWSQVGYALTVAPGSRQLRLELTPGRIPPPVAYDQLVSTDEDTSAAITLLAEDAAGAALSYAIVEPPAHGAVIGAGPELTYGPAADYHGPDSFSFVASNGSAESNVARVSITVSSVNDPPTVSAVSATTFEDVPVPITLSGTDVDGDALSFNVVSAPLHGALSGSGAVIVYSSAPDFNGSDGFAYAASDGEAQSTPASVTIAVAPVHDPPEVEFTVPGPARNAATRDNNLASTLEGARLVAFTSQAAGTPATNALDDDLFTFWQTTSGQNANQAITLELPAGAPPIDRVRLVNGYALGGAAAKRFEVRVSTTTSEPDAFATALSDVALDNDRLQDFVFAAPVAARYVTFTALDNHGSACCIAVRNLELVAPDLAGVPSYAYTPANVALASEGASVMATSQFEGFGANLAIDGSTATRWASGGGQPMNQSLTVTLARAKSYPLERIRIANAFGAAGQAVKDFRLGLSNTTSEDSAFTTVLSGSLQDISGFQEFAIPGGPMAAKHVRFTAVNNYSSACCVSIQELQVLPVAGPPASVSSYLNPLNRAEMALDEVPSTFWQTASGQTANQYLEVRLNGPVASVAGVRLLGWTAGHLSSVKDFDVLVSDSGDDDAAFSLALSQTLPNDGLAHDFSFPGGPRRARYVRLVAKNNQGGPATIVATFEVRTEASDAHLLTTNAALLGASSELSAAFGAVKALDANPEAPGWVTAIGQSSNQWLKLELPLGRTWAVDHVALQPRADGVSNQSPRDFEVQVSTTTADDDAFAAVLVGTLRNDFSVQHFFFPSAEARYLRLLLKNNYGGTAIGLQRFGAYSPQIGPASVRFLDQSVGRDAPLRGWQWSFGDGATAVERDPLQAFAQTGLYDVTLAVTDESGATSSMSRSYQVVASPQASFTTAPTAPAEGQAVVFTDTSVDPAGIVYREWLFGDGASFASAQPSASHAFPDNGTYATTLRVTNAWGAVSEATANVGVANAAPGVEAGTNARLIVGAQWPPLSVISDPGTADGSSLSCAWSFGDGQSQAIPVCTVASSRVPHLYVEAGVYTATLTVTDKDGGVASDGLTVTVFPEHAAIPDGTYIEPPYWDDYSVKELGGVAGLPNGYGGLVFDRSDPGRLLVASPAINGNGKIYSVGVVRDAGGHVIGWSGAPTPLVDLPNDDGGLVYGRDGVLFSAQWPDQKLIQVKPGSAQIDKQIFLPALGPRDVSLNIVPYGFPGACSLKLVSYFTGRWWSAQLQPDGLGTFDLSGVTEASPIFGGGAEHLVYVPRGAPVFEDGTVLVTEWDLGNVASYSIDANGDPIAATRRLVITGFPSPEAFAIDPLTGDLFITSLGGSRIRRISGFPAPSRDLSLTPGAATSVGSSHTLTVRVADGGGAGRAGVGVQVAVTAGPNAGAPGSCAPDAGCVTGEAGEVLFAYVGATAGRDTVTASFTTDSCDTRAVQASVDWTSTNQTPVAIAASVTTPEDLAVAISLAASDPDGDPLTFAVSSVPAHGTLAGTLPNLIYTPAPNFYGSDSLTFTASDGQSQSGAAVLTIDVTPVNDPPVAQAGGATVAEDGAVDVTLVGADADGDPLTFSVVTPPQFGALSGTGPTLRYVPAGNFHGQDSFSFAVSDGHGTSDPAAVAIDVASVNDAPVAQDQSLSALETTPRAVTLGATDADGDALIYSVVAAPQHGSLSGAAPNLSYDPAPGYTGPDSFTFQASDGQASSNIATLSIEVAPNNHAPTAFDAAATTLEDTPVSVTLVAFDIDLDLLAFTIVTPPAHGTLSGAAPAVTYTPAADEHGSDSFTYQVSDGELASSVATVTLTVSAVNDPPVAADQTLEVTQGVPSPVVLTATDVDGDSLTYSILAEPTHGAFSGAAPNLFYTSAGAYTGSDSFTFLVNDGRADSVVATVSLAVVAVSNHAPSCSSAQPNLAILWPPNHKMKGIQVTGVTDADGDPVTILAKRIRQDEPVEGAGDGNRSPDGTLTPLQVRSERSGGGDGRVYHVSFEATDGEGAGCTGTVTVCVPHDQGGGGCVDGGALYDSTVEQQ